MDRGSLIAKVEELGFSVKAVSDEPSLPRHAWQKLLAFAVVAVGIIAGGIYAFQWSKEIAMFAGPALRRKLRPATAVAEDSEPGRGGSHRR